MSLLVLVLLAVPAQEDLTCLDGKGADALLARDDVESLHLAGIGAAGPVVLHAAVIDSRFASVTVRGSIESWLKDVVARPLMPDVIGLVVPGALKKYDLPDLRKHLGSRLRIERD